jgi:hypothetical protein
MDPGNIRGQVDAVWNAFWARGTTDQIEMIEQIAQFRFFGRLTRGPADPRRAHCSPNQPKFGPALSCGLSGPARQLRCQSPPVGVREHGGRQYVRPHCRSYFARPTEPWYPWIECQPACHGRLLRRRRRLACSPRSQGLGIFSGSLAGLLNQVEARGGCVSLGQYKIDRFAAC